MISVEPIVDDFCTSPPVHSSTANDESALKEIQDWLKIQNELKSRVSQGIQDEIKGAVQTQLDEQSPQQRFASMLSNPSPIRLSNSSTSWLKVNASSSPWVAWKKRPGDIL